MPGSTPALELSRITKYFGGLAALDDASMIVRPGTIHALLGENGAGKTTLMRVVYGMVRPDGGTISVGGQERRLPSPLAAIAAGVGMVHQHFTLVPAMTVAENLAIGGHGLLRTHEMKARVRAIAERTGFALDPDIRVESLSVGAQQRVEIAKALARSATLLILDEPTAMLAPPEIDDLLVWLRTYADTGCAVVLITHKLREALAVADDVTVLRRGRSAFSGRAASTSAEQLTIAMIGVAPVVGPTPVHPPPTAVGSTPVFAARCMSVRAPGGRVRVREATFTVYGGELVGIVAVEGSGQHELLRALAGRYDVSAGTLDRPTVAGFVPEDRQRDAIHLDRSIAETVALRGAGTRHGTISWGAVRENATALVHAYDVRAEGTMSPVRSLSGGNQQKLVLAREMEATADQPVPSAIIVENPTRGLDVRATAAVHSRLREACARGAAVVVYSSDLDEVLALASRVLVLFDGNVREVPPDRDLIGRAMLGLHEDPDSPAL